MDPELMDRLAKRSFADRLVNAAGRFAKGISRPDLLAKEAPDDGLERMLKYNQLMTGSPEFKMQEAQTRSNMAVQQALDIEDAKRNAAGMRYDTAVGGTPFGSTSESVKTEPLIPGKVYADGVAEYDTNIGRVIKKPLPASIENRKIKATDDLYETVSSANVNYDRIDKGMKSASNIPQGLPGKVKLTWMKWFDTDNPTLGDWQDMKSLLTDAQLQKTVITKGSVSDREMAEFSQAVANDDIASVMRQSKVLDAYKQSVFADQEQKLSSFKRNFYEDPREWADLNVRNPFESMKGGQVPAFLNQDQGQEIQESPLESRKNSLRAKYGNR